jgi:flagellar basal body-associated protein FliL
MALIDKGTILKGLWDVVLISAAGAVCVFGSRLAVDHALASASEHFAAQPTAFPVGPQGLPLAGGHAVDLGEGHGAEKGMEKGHKGKGNKVSQPYPLRTTVVNLAGDSNHRFAKVTITLEADSAEVVKELQAVDHQIYDCLIDTLGNVRAQDIGSDVGKDMLKETLRTKMNKFLKEGEILNVYLTEFLVQ